MQPWPRASGVCLVACLLAGPNVRKRPQVARRRRRRSQKRRRTLSVEARLEARCSGSSALRVKRITSWRVNTWIPH